MKTVRKTLKRIGWPIDAMSDRQVKQELYRRWFACHHEDMDEAAPISVASAKGIVVSMVSQGNLDTLCWSPDDNIPYEDVVSQEDDALFGREQVEDEHPFSERRASKRRPAKELVHWCLSGGDAEEATGWLIDRSLEGIAFIAQTNQAPHLGARITPSIHSRSDGAIGLGSAVVVRTEELNGELTLVCARIEDGSWLQSP